MSRILPILFNTEMVRAILDGRKTVTRRVVKPQPKMRLCYTFAGYGHGKWHYPDKNAWEYWGEEFKRPDNIESDELKRTWTPPCHTDDILYVQETWSPVFVVPRRYLYKVGCAEANNLLIKWRPSIHMPKEAARIFLKVTDVRVERLQEMTASESSKEGIRLPKEYDTKERAYILGFADLWDSTIKKSDFDLYGWDANPWVWVIEFERCEKPEGWCV